jgi:4-hydroxy-3-methylbut-2-enyl diphosphate reductase
MVLTAATLFAINGVVAKTTIASGLSAYRLGEVRTTWACIGCALVLAFLDRSGFRLERHEAPFLLAFGFASGSPRPSSGSSRRSSPPPGSARHSGRVSSSAAPWSRAGSCSPEQHADGSLTSRSQVAATMPAVVKRVLLASPRGYCAGVERAIETVEQALSLHGPPVYVRRQIVHNTHVVADLERRGAVFVESEEEVPPGAVLILSAHGVAPAVYENAGRRGLVTIDATCPLVTKVHVEVRRFAAEGGTVILVGHRGHDEVVGTMGEAPGSVVLVQSVDDARSVPVPDPDRVAYVTQTTLSVDDTRAIVGELVRRFPGIRGPAKDDICYATSNRQQAVKELLPEVDLLLVIGSNNSSNSNRLVEVARSGGVRSYLIEDETAIDERWLDGVETVGVTSGASAPETLVTRVCDWFRDRGVGEIRALRPVLEDVVFRLPSELRRAVPAA